MALLPGAAYSPLDAKAIERAESVVEEVYRSPPLGSIVGMARWYFGSDDAGLALRKALHLTFENRLRAIALEADPPQSHGAPALAVDLHSHPLDADLAQRLGVPTSVGSRRARQLLAVVTGALGLLARTLGYLAAARGVPSPQRCDVAAPAMSGIPGVALAAMSASMRDRLETLVIVHERDEPGAFAQWPGRRLTLKSLSPSFAAWLPHTSRTLLFLIGALALAVRHASNAFALEAVAEALRLAASSQRWLVLSHHLDAGCYLDIYENSPDHILKRIWLRNRGTKIVRWPYSQMDLPGASLSYLGYDVFLSAGPYQSHTYSRSWSSDCRSVSVGHIQWDKRFIEGASSKSDEVAKIEQKLSQGLKMAVLFGPSLVPGSAELMVELFSLMTVAFPAQEGWFVLVKPKIGHDLFPVLNIHSPATADVVWLRYPDAVESFPTASLIPRMQVGVTYGGTVQLECLVRGRPCFAFRRGFQTTPLIERLLSDGFLQCDRRALLTALASWKQAGASIDYDWYQNNFDPFCDDKALDRSWGVLQHAALRATPGRVLEPQALAARQR